MALFAVGCRHLSSSAGAKSLHPVPDLSSAERFRTLCLVKRKRSFWPWKKYKITPTFITLNDVLQQTVDAAPFTSTNDIMEKYEESPSFAADGDLGSKIATELDIDLKIVDTFTLIVDFGDIMKTEVNWESLERSLETTKINMNHRLIKELKAKKGKRTSLCIVLESLSCKVDGPLEETSSAQVSGIASAGIQTTVSVDVHLSGKVEQKKHHSFTVPPGTVLAYSCTKMNISEDGSVTMHVGTDTVDALPSRQQLREGKEDTVVKHIQASLAPLMNAINYSELKKAVVCLLDSRESIIEMVGLISTARVLIEEKETSSIPADTVSKMFGSSTGWKDLLKLIGFKLPEQFVNGSVIEYPKTDPDHLLNACWALLESLTDLTEQQLKFLKDCSTKHGKVMLHVIKNGILGKDTPATDAGISDCIASNQGKEVEFLHSLGFVREESEKVKFLTLKWDVNDSINDAYAALFVLFSK